MKILLNLAPQGGEISLKLNLDSNTGQGLNKVYAKKPLISIVL